MEKTKIGTTHGLAASTQSSDPEQVYVFVTDYTQDHPDFGVRPRPVRIEFWKGYAVPNAVNLTREQATELIDLLAEAAVKSGS